MKNFHFEHFPSGNIYCMLGDVTIAIKLSRGNPTDYLSWYVDNDIIGIYVEQKDLINICKEVADLYKSWERLSKMVKVQHEN